MPEQKQKLKNLIKEAGFLSKEEKLSWLELIKTLNESQLKEVTDHFEKQIKHEKDLKLKLIVKHGKEKKLLSDVVKISKKYYSKAKKHKK